jgi:hypothetical protein
MWSEKVNLKFFKMNTKKIFSLLLYLFGEALIIVSFLYFGQNIQTDILTLNIIVSSVIFSLLFLDIIIPWVDFKDKSQKKIGSLGVRWFFTFLYIFLAIGAMISFNKIRTNQFVDQLIIHGVLFFLLLLGLFLAFLSSKKVGAVYVEEKPNRDLIDKMKKATQELQMKLDSEQNIPSEILSRLTFLQDDLRFLSPCNNDDAMTLELKFIKEIKALNDCFFDLPINIEKIDCHLKSCEFAVKERKQIFSK